MVNQNYKTVNPNTFIERLKKLRAVDRGSARKPKAVFFTSINIFSKPKQ